MADQPTDSGELIEALRDLAAIVRQNLTTAESIAADLVKPEPPIKRPDARPLDADNEHWEAWRAAVCAPAVFMLGVVEYLRFLEANGTVHPSWLQLDELALSVDQAFAQYGVEVLLDSGWI